MWVRGTSSIRRWGVAAIALLALSATGCATLRGNPRDDIVNILQFPASPPWLRDNDGRIVGLQSRVYFVSAATERGEFVVGPFTAELVISTPRSDGYYDHERVHQWNFGHPEVDGFRVSKRAGMGDSYGLVLVWPKELDLTGREIYVVYNYRRTDGRVISRNGARLLVPLPPAVTPRPATAPAKSGASPAWSRT